MSKRTHIFNFSYLERSMCYMQVVKENFNETYSHTLIPEIILLLNLNNKVSKKYFFAFFLIHEIIIIIRSKIIQSSDFLNNVNISI